MNNVYYGGCRNTNRQKDTFWKHGWEHRQKNQTAPEMPAKKPRPGNGTNQKATGLTPVNGGLLRNQVNPNDNEKNGGDTLRERKQGPEQKHVPKHRNRPSYSVGNKVG